MSKAVRMGVGILAVIVVASAGVAVFALLQKQTLEQRNQSLNNQLTDTQQKADALAATVKKLEGNAQQMNNQIASQTREKGQIQGLYDELKRKADDVQSQLDQASRERDDWKSRLETAGQERDDWKKRSETARHERDDLMEKLKNRPKEIVYKEKEPAATDAGAQGEGYWAGVLKQKAALELELEKAKADLDQNALQVVELKKQNSDLQLQIKQVTNEKDEIERKIKYGEDLANNLSLETARARNDQKFTADRADKLKEENLGLQAQVKQLTSSKLMLEKTISRLTGDKEGMQKKLAETESVIQGRIDEIWQIKESLDKKLSENSGKSNGPMELPPIIVNANKGEGQQASAQPAARHQGSIISINESNNFVITDLGEDNSPVKVGGSLKVYRGSKEVATLEVIQVRKDISAADIKRKSSALKVGDTVKFNG